MKIEHVALWTHDIERLKSFYVKYFEAKPGPLYFNEKKQFQSYFLTFSTGARLELMHQVGVVSSPVKDSKVKQSGFTHLAVSVGSMQAVDKLTRRLVDDGYRLISSPRRTGDGYYESVIQDPDANLIEITI